jgi:integrase
VTLLRKLFIQKDDGTYEELAAIIADRDLQAIKKTPLDKAIQEYIKNCTSQKHPNNQKSEKLYLKKFGAYLAERNVSTMDEVKRKHMDGFEAILMKKMKASSVNRRMCPIKQLFSKAFEWEMIYKNPCFGMKIQKEEKNPFRAWSPELVKKFLLLCSGLWKDIFTFLWYTGARPMEVKNLRWTDVDFEKGELTFKCGKNAQVSRTFLMTDEVDKLLHSIKMQSPYVFADNKRQLSNDNLYQYCKKRMKKLGAIGYTVYGIRHGFATNLAKNGANAFEIAQCMGHTSLDTTRRYVHNDKKSLIEKIKKANQF